MRRALITTTINVPENLRAWAAQLDDTDVVVVAGDVKTPHDEVKKLLSELTCRTSYVGTSASEWSVDGCIGHNTIQRRNLALLEALKQAPDVDYIITVDDDNWPSSYWVEEVDGIFSGEGSTANLISTDTAWFNPGALCSPSVVHRGYPLSLYRSSPTSIIDNLTDLDQFRGHTNIGVFASLWTGAADVDAIHRMVKGDHVDSVWGDAVLQPGTWAPFNSQATAFRRELAPYMMMWPHCGRFDDIWASYVMRAVMDARGWRVRYGRPTVHQERNPHNHVKDLEAELIGYRHNETVIAALRRLSANIRETDPMPVIVRKLHDVIDTLTFLPGQTVMAMDAWVKDLARLTAVYGVNLEGTPR